MNQNHQPASPKIWKPLYYVMGFVFTLLILSEIGQFLNDDRPELLRKHGIVAFEKPVPIAHYNFRDLEGNQHRFKDYQGKNSVLMFWATWCGYCAREYPEMDAYFAEAKDRINIIPIAHTEDLPDAIENFYSRLGIKHLPAFWVYGVGLHRHMQIRGYPSFFILDKKARVVAQARPNWKSGDLAEALAVFEKRQAKPVASQ
jgi:thiol-disulfide isomerase/thioredoxin